MDDKSLRNYRWASHLPALNSVMQYYKPSGILELGLGKYSTPLLYSFNKKLISIETDKSWVEEVSKSLKPRENFQIIHHDLGIYFRRTSTTISNDIKKSCIKFYKSFIKDDVDFLFVDHVAGLRGSSILGLLNFFKYIVYHDAEEPQLYGYEQLTTERTEEFVHILNKLPYVHTGILIRKKNQNSISDFIDVLDKNNKEYCLSYDINYKKDIEILEKGVEK